MRKIISGDSYPIISTLKHPEITFPSYLEGNQALLSGRLHCVADYIINRLFHLFPIHRNPRSIGTQLLFQKNSSVLKLDLERKQGFL